MSEITLLLRICLRVVDGEKFYRFVLTKAKDVFNLCKSAVVKSSLEYASCFFGIKVDRENRISVNSE